MINNYISDEEMLKLAKQDRPISRDELGIKSPNTNDGLSVLPEGFDLKILKRRTKIMSDGLQEIKLFKTGQDLIAYDGEHYYKVEPCKYMDSKTSYITYGFKFIAIEKGEQTHDI